MSNVDCHVQNLVFLWHFILLFGIIIVHGNDILPPDVYNLSFF